MARNHGYEDVVDDATAAVNGVIEQRNHRDLVPLMKQQLEALKAILKALTPKKRGPGRPPKIGSNGM